MEILLGNLITPSPDIAFITPYVFLQIHVDHSILHKGDHHALEKITHTAFVLTPKRNPNALAGNMRECIHLTDSVDHVPDEKETSADEKLQPLWLCGQIHSKQHHLVLFNTSQPHIYPMQVSSSMHVPKTEESTSGTTARISLDPQASVLELPLNPILPFVVQRGTTQHMIAHPRQCRVMALASSHELLPRPVSPLRSDHPSSSLPPLIFLSLTHS